VKILLSYPRSGNHLVRFFIELLSETPTLGCKDNIKDVSIYQNSFLENLPFNITSLNDYKLNNLFVKYHFPPEEISEEIIFIVRNPKEVLLRHNNYKLKLNGWDGFNSYFNSIEYYNNFKGKKILFFYEDIITNKVEFIIKLCLFLNNVKEEKKNYVINNIDKLFELSKNGKNRIWGGVNSDSINYYYNRISDLNFKKEFDNYIESKINNPKYDIIKSKYFTPL
jgi:hypothetical protein